MGNGLECVCVCVRFFVCVCMWFIVFSPPPFFFVVVCNSISAFLFFSSCLKLQALAWKSPGG